MLAREHQVEGDLCHPVVLLYCDWLSGLQRVDAWELPHFWAEALRYLHQVMQEVRAELDGA